MGTYFVLNLDTVAPEIQVFAPIWVPIARDLFVSVDVNEPIDLGRQNAELIDSLGESHQFILDVDEGSIYAIVDTNLLPVGLATIVITLWDEAGNPTTVTKGINVVTGGDLLGEITSVETRDSAVLQVEYRETEMILDFDRSSVVVEVRDSNLVIEQREFELSIEEVQI